MGNEENIIRVDLIRIGDITALVDLEQFFEGDIELLGDSFQAIAILDDEYSLLGFVEL